MTKKPSKEHGKEGGKATKEKYGTEHFKKIAEKRWKKEKSQSE